MPEEKPVEGTHRLSFRVDSIRFSGSIHPTRTASRFVVLVGPNNGGKSRTLRELRQAIEDPDEPGRAVVMNIEATRVGDAEALSAWMSDAAYPEPSVDRSDVHLLGFGGARVSARFMPTYWTQPGLGSLTPFLVGYIDAETRLRLTNPVPAVDALEPLVDAPLQRLFVDHQAEQRLSSAVERAFRLPVTVNRTGGTSIHLLLGRSEEEARLDNAAYLQDLVELPKVEMQGDGMRSYIGVLLSAFAAPFQIILIDEPEAFLHPPQAREIGRQLARTMHSAAASVHPDGPRAQADTVERDGSTTTRGSEMEPPQVFIATHSTDVLVGLLDSGVPLSIVRLVRVGETNVPALLETDRVRELWSDPVLRYTNLLDALFHQGAVLCEAEGDAVLYSAALDSDRDDRNDDSDSIMFASSGGKHKLPQTVGALTAAGVPVAAIADIDVLRKEDLLRKIVEALGAEWTEHLAQMRRLVAGAIETRPAAAPLIGDVSDEIARALGSDRTARLSEEQTRHVRDITRSTDGWRHIRESGGISAIPNGQATATAHELLGALAKCRLFVVEVGMLEGWGAALGAHGTQFAQRALEARIHETNPALRSFVRRVTESVVVPTQSPPRLVSSSP